MGLLLLLLLVVVANAFHVAVDGVIEEEEATLLLAFKKSSVRSDPKGVLGGWNISSSSSACSWRGVSCSDHDRRVVSIDLSGSSLGGPLHLHHISALPSLRRLSLRDNSFSAGDLSVSNCAGVEEIDLSSNAISGEIAFPAAACSRLAHLNLSRNHITKWPSALPPRLSTLDISFNLITGNALPTPPPTLAHLDLSFNNFSADFSTLDLGPCSTLTILRLSHATLSASGFPATLRNCRLLHTLDLSHNDLRSDIPAAPLAALSSLRRLSLSHNHFSGGIPPQLCPHPPALEELDLSANDLSGGLPPSFAQCSSLAALDLSANRLSGDFLGSVVSRLQSLTHLRAAFNNITGPVPVSLANCTALRVLDLSSNALTGNIPEGFCSGASWGLEKLLLANNYLSGEVPEELGRCKSLKSINLSFNKLSGPIPTDIWRLPNISELIMWANSISGGIPEGICSNNQLQMLILNNNLLGGTLPSSIVNCTNMMWISLSANRLSGQLPRNLHHLPNLAILQIGNNSFSGPIPPELGLCRSLIWLDLNSNNFTGPIPTHLADQAGLVPAGIVSGKHFAFVRNEGGSKCRGAGGLIEFEGVRPERLDTLPIVHSCSSTRIYSGMTVYTFASNGSMIYLDLSYNALSGPIPDSLGNVVYLQVLNLGHNSLTGEIPEAFGGLRTVGVLDLSHNKLEGPVPGALASLSFLSDLDVSNNLLTGAIPSGGQLTTFPTARYENNSGLCGLPLPPCGGAARGRKGAEGGKRKEQPIIGVGLIMGVAFFGVCALMLTVTMYMMRRKEQRGGNEEEQEAGDDSLSSSSGNGAGGAGLSINVATFEKPLRKLTLGQLMEATNGFSAESLIGAGGFGEVYKARLKDGCVVAIKKLTRVTGQGEREFMAEMETIGKIKHRNLVALLGYCKVGEERLLVYEYMPWGSLEAVLHEWNTPLCWEARKRIAVGSARGLAFLHHSCIPHIIHRDMKSSNVLLDASLEPRVSDFGMARLLNAVDTHLSVTTLAGTPGYVPPEYYQSFRCSTKGDVYSFGVVLLELLSRRRPTDSSVFGDDNNIVGWARQLHRDRRTAHIFDPDLLSDPLNHNELSHYLQIAFDCLDDRPLRRPTMIQVLAKFKDAAAAADNHHINTTSCT